MDAFAADYLANLTADLTGRVLEAAGRRLREAFLGTERERALARCLEAGIVALLASASAQEPYELDLMAAIFGAFFQDPDVGREVTVLLRSWPLDVEVLLCLLKEAGYEEGELPGLDPGQSLILFERAILSALAAEPALQGVLQTPRLLEKQEGAAAGRGKGKRGANRAALRGDGAIAQGPGATAAGKGGVVVSGDVHGGIHLGDRGGGEP